MKPRPLIDQWGWFVLSKHYFTFLLKNRRLITKSTTIAAAHLYLVLSKLTTHSSA